MFARSQVTTSPQSSCSTFSECGGTTTTLFSKISNVHGAKDQSEASQRGRDPLDQTKTQYEKGNELSSGILKSTHNGAVLCCAALEVKLRKEKGARGNLVGSQEDS